MKLSDIACRRATSQDKPYKLTDGGGLYLLVQPNGSKLWRMKYFYLGKEKLLAIGVYSTITLAEARAKREEVKKLLANGKDPAAQKREDQLEALRKASNTFEALAREWHEKQKDQWTPRHAGCVMRRLEANVFPHIGSRLVQEITALELLECVLRRIEKRGAIEVAARVKQICGQVFRYGIVTGRCERDPSYDLKDALKKVRGSHYAALDIKEMPKFLAALERNDARLYGRTRRAIRLLMLCFTRTSELIYATWDEFDLESGVWEIPAEREPIRKFV